MKIIPNQIPRKKPFKYATIGNDVLYDTNISGDAKILLIILLNWDKKKTAHKPNITYLSNLMKLPKRTFNRLVVELKNHGYLKSIGDKHNTIWEIYEIPINATSGTKTN